MYTIKHVADTLGVSASTLRAWERRYGVVAAQRTEAGYRLYDDAAIETLRSVQRLVEQGRSVREAVEEIRRLEVAWATLDPGAPAPGEGGVARPASPALLEVHPDTVELLTAAASLAPAQLRAVLDRQFAVDSIPTMLDDWLLPSLVALGTGWEQGRVSVAGEHLVSHAVLRRVGEVYESMTNASLGPRVMIGLPAHGRHELGLLSFAVVARASGLRTTYLGADLPALEWGRMVERGMPDAVVLSASMERDVPNLAEAVAAVRSVSERCVIAVGGALQDRAPEGVVRLGHRLSDAVVTLAELLNPARESAG